jgi:hypothetical protein
MWNLKKVNLEAERRMMAGNGVCGRGIWRSSSATKLRLSKKVRTLLYNMEATVNNAVSNC